ncbi:MAG: hypothetical protein HY399_06450 [Elusimicrobia bacterium]|nr:hypothetical protein [Elusimicrobiota bacterium]
MSPRWVFPLVVFAAALSVRWGYLFGIAGVGGELKGDAMAYHAHAVNLLTRGVYADSQGFSAVRMPGYPLFLAAVYSVFGPSPAAVQIVQCVLDAGTCVLLGLVASWILGTRMGWFCGLSAAIYYDLFSPCALLYSEPFCLFLWAIFFCALYYPKISSERRALAVGLILGAVFLVRPEALLFAPMVALCLPKVWKGTSWRSVGFCLLLFFSVGVLPWTLRNWQVLGKPAVTTSVSHYNAFLGLWLPAHQIWGVPAPVVTVTGELERDAAYAQELKKLRKELSWKKIILAHGYDFFTLFYPFLPQYDVTFVLLVPLWVWGLYKSREVKEFWPLSILFLYLAAAYTLFGGPVSRYRQNFTPSLVLLSGLGLKSLQERFQKVSLNWGLGGWAGLQGLIWIFHPQIRQWALSLKEWVWR